MKRNEHQSQKRPTRRFSGPPGRCAVDPRSHSGLAPGALRAIVPVLFLQPGSPASGRGPLILDVSAASEACRLLRGASPRPVRPSQPSVSSVACLADAIEAKRFAHVGGTRDAKRAQEHGPGSREECTLLKRFSPERKWIRFIGNV